jgi:choline dehydrogenase-like flavoprotein
VINLNLLSSEFDLFAMRESIKAIRRLFSLAPFQGFILQSSFNGTTDGEIEEFIRESVVAALHQVGSASMSPKDADWGVVDPDLKLKGAQGVRVVDASVLVRQLFIFSS